ncbi:DNA-directed RNA polymerase subunit omega [Acetoanaerobium pronyense]|uniref:DNA-directed RNA polymerase subunit omega n=1 Tax=Acetoanaerobium pronyense TaxID=1482736 RepID=A0ABS4KFS4_9FIRM|nr:DNA-directed RNA polymerase subunit omega [Acetoanaerobium pronyense]MBP2026638.1 DNA-directed RNA polymerase subunit omega [Acetoanaerobium pronyense]
MLYPSINDLLKIADSRYALVNEVSKRARQIVDGSDMLIDTDDIKPVSIATTEVFEEKVTYKVTFFEEFDLNFEENQK